MDDHADIIHRKTLLQVTLIGDFGPVLVGADGMAVCGYSGASFGQDAKEQGHRSIPSPTVVVAILTPPRS